MDVGCYTFTSTYSIRRRGQRAQCYENRNFRLTFPSYCPSSIASITSGAIQYGVPTKLLAGHLMLALPKSASLTVPFSVSRMFPALMSRWMRPRLCRYDRPHTTPSQIAAISSSRRGRLCTWLYKYKEKWEYKITIEVVKMQYRGILMFTMYINDPEPTFVKPKETAKFRCLNV